SITPLPRTAPRLPSKGDSRRVKSLGKRWKDAGSSGQREPRSSWSLAPVVAPEGVSLPPNRRDHERHVRKINRYLEQVHVSPDVVLKDVLQKRKNMEDTGCTSISAATLLSANRSLTV
ncbi:unnamed protein product, partial [Cladocopium goreaui]